MQLSCGKSGAKKIGRLRGTLLRGRGSPGRLRKRWNDFRPD